MKRYHTVALLETGLLGEDAKLILSSFASYGIVKLQ